MNKTHIKQSCNDDGDDNEKKNIRCLHCNLKKSKQDSGKPPSFAYNSGEPTCADYLAFVRRKAASGGALPSNTMDRYCIHIQTHICFHFFGQAAQLFWVFVSVVSAECVCVCAMFEGSAKDGSGGCCCRPCATRLFRLVFESFGWCDCGLQNGPCISRPRAFIDIYTRRYNLRSEKLSR